VAPPAEGELLSEFMRRRGYTTAAVVSNRVLAARAGWDRGFDEYFETWARAPEVLEDPVVLKSWLAAPRVNELALPLLERHRGTERLFVWLHYSDPHTPYTLPDGFDNPFRGGDPSPVPSSVGPSAELEGLETLGEYVARYDANVLIADRAIGEVLERARVLGLTEDALIVFTADHGESLV
jgi:arylsulfatase